MVTRAYHHISPSLLQPLQHTPRFAKSFASLFSKLIVYTGVFIVNDTFEVTLTENAIFKPRCTGGPSGIFHGGFGDNSTVTDLQTPFYSSTTPQIFAIAVATVVSYFLVILIFITPRTFFVGGPGGGAGFLTRRGLSGNSSVVGVGRRPLLQKIAAVTVAISMTIATADTFKVAESQYENGFMDSEGMVKQVVGGLEIRVVRVVSDTFLWLAQVQTLIRLFPRHKEKVTIKWLGFALILLDVIFSSLNNFLVSSTNTKPNTKPLKYRDAIPALSYLFELAIGFIYASCIIYYSLSKYRFAFYHAKMRNICLVALLSIVSVLIPVVFFVIDVSSPNIAAWGFYIRWVGAAAASVVVWEWVERIEALERDEKKDGILGREIYDGDEMLYVTTANGVDWPGRRSRRDSHGSEDKGNTQGLRDRWVVKSRSLRSRVPFHSRKNTNGADTATSAESEAMPSTADHDVSSPAPPAAVATPISRADTTSAASTVYAVRYHHLHTSSPQIPEDGPYQHMIPKKASIGSTPGNAVAEKDSAEHTGREQFEIRAGSRNKSLSRPLWTAVSNPFKRKRALLPAEVAGAQMLDVNSHRRSPAAIVNLDKWNLKSKIDAFTTIQRDKVRARRHQAGGMDAPLPVTIIPAQPRGTRTWSPDDLTEATDATNHPPNRGDDGQSHNSVQPSRNGGQMHVAVVHPRIGGLRTWSPEDMHHYEEPLSQGGGAHYALARQEEPSDTELFTGDQLSSELQESVQSDLPPEAVETRFDGVEESSLSCVTPLTNAEHTTPPPEAKPSSHELNSHGLRRQPATSPRPSEAPVSPQLPETLLPSSSPESEDSQALPDGGQDVAPAEQHGSCH